MIKTEYINNICLFDKEHKVQINVTIKVLGEVRMLEIRESLPESLFNQLKQWAEDVTALKEKET